MIHPPVPPFHQLPPPPSSDHVDGRSNHSHADHPDARDIPGNRRMPTHRDLRNILQPPRLTGLSTAEEAFDPIDAHES
ncbi:hypothetical protein [Paludisphaera sp.]|uniref:hypothetical protein n=1 Tax=Paludisphaera sp. TaxID=2017432 RepID=UPI00301CDECC